MTSLNCKSCNKEFSSDYIHPFALRSPHAQKIGFFCSIGCKNAAKRDRMKKNRETKKVETCR